MQLLPALGGRWSGHPRHAVSTTGESGDLILRPMRLAVVETSPHGGLLHYAVQLGDAVAERGHDVDLIIPRENELSRSVGPARRRAVLAPAVRSSRLPRSRALYLVRRALVALQLVRALTRATWELRRGRYEAAIINYDLTLSLVAGATLLAELLPGGPALVNVCHNVRPYDRSAGGGLYARSSVLLGLLRRLYARFDLVLVHGERSRAEFEAAWPSAPIGVIPHGDERIFAAEPPAPADEERVLFFGDWRKVKGLSVLMDAFDQLARRRPGARLTVAGTPAPADWDPDLLRRWADRHRERVRLVDRYVPIEDVPSLFGEARVVVTPYLTGYQSGVVQLAMTMGRAVVASDVGDLGSAVIDGVTGRLVPPGDRSALARALEEVVADAGLADRMGAAGRRRALEGSSWEVVAERLEGELGWLRDRTGGWQPR